ADRLVIAVGIHPGKAPLFPFEDRLAMLADVCAPIAKASGCAISTVTFEDLVVALARREGASILIRGLRDASDFDYEMQMAGMNPRWAPGGARVVHPGAAAGPPDPRHTGPPDRRHGGRRERLRAGEGRGPSQGQVRLVPRTRS